MTFPFTTLQSVLTYLLQDIICKKNSQTIAVYPLHISLEFCDPEFSSKVTYVDLTRQLRGPQGESGLPGVPGSQGAAGLDGADGQDGLNGTCRCDTGQF